jgi:membrane-bound ClpP family serine protease
MKNLKQFQMLPGKSKRSIIIKYVLLQIPDTALAVVVLLILVRWANVSVWLAVCLAVLWVLKDIIMFPLLWQSFAGAALRSWHDIAGAEGVVTEKCDPHGYVLVHGERWKAESKDERGSIDKGARIVVTGNKGLTLHIKRKDA